VTPVGGFRDWKTGDRRIAMTLLDRYIVRELLAAVAFGAIVSGSFLLANQFLVYQT
jgi:hypothetical protein